MLPNIVVIPNKESKFNKSSKQIISTWSMKVLEQP